MKKQKFISLLCAGSMLAAQGSVFAASTDKVYTTDNEKSIDFGKTFLGHVYGYGDADNLKTLDFSEIFGGTAEEPTTYTVTPTDSKLTVDKVSAEAGETITITATPDNGYEVDKYIVDGVEQDGNTFTMPEKNVEVSAIFKKVAYSITAPAEVKGLPAESVWGETLEFTVEVADDKEIVSVKVNENAIEATDGTYSFTMPMDDVTIAVETKDKEVESTDTAPVYPGEEPFTKTFKFEEIFGGTVVEPTTYTVTATGNVTVDKASAEAGETITITATPDEGYVVDKYVVDGVEQSENTFAMPEKNIEVSATFKKVAYSITAPAEVKGLPAESVWGETLEFTVEVADDKEIVSVKVNNEAKTAVDGKYSFEMPKANVTITVETEDKVVTPDTYIVTATGNVTVDKASAEAGETITITATPDEGYVVDKYVVDGVEQDGNTFTMPEKNIEVSATFKKVAYSITAPAEVKGLPAESVWGETLEFTVEVADDKEIVSVKVNDEAKTAVDGKYSFEMPKANVTITVETQDKVVVSDRITLPSTKNGKVTVDKEAPAAGEEVTITVETDKGYKLTKLEVKDSEGNDVTVTDNKFTMPENNITISAEFEAIEYKVEIEVGKNGDAEFTVEGEEVEIAVIGDDINISVDPNKNYTLKKITYSYVDEKGNTKTVTVRNKTFKMPAYDVVIEVTFEKKASSSNKSGGSGGGIGVILPSDGTLTPEETITEIIFDDVAEGTWYEADIDYVAEKGIMTGVADRTFDPNGVVTRAMVVATLQRLEAPDYANTNTPFADVAADAWYAKSVAWAYENGIVKGMSDTEYAPDALVTREQLAAILDRYVDAYHKEIDATADISGYVDSALVSDWAVESVASAVGMGIISGTDAGELNPLGNATRAEYATMLSRCMRKIGK